MNTRALSALVLLACSCTDGPGGTPHASSDTTAPATGNTNPEPTTTASSTGADTSTPTTGADTTAGASGPSTGLPTGSTGLTTGDPSGGPAMLGVYARWEVRDNTGTPVEIWASPTCSPDGGCYGGDFSTPVYDCMHIQYVGQTAVGLAFDLDTGNPEPCYGNYASWADASVYYFFDAACSQPALLTYQVFTVGGVLYYGSGDQAVVPAMYYIESGGMCVGLPNTSLSFSEPVPVPASILDMAPDAPYEIAVAY